MLTTLPTVASVNAPLNFDLNGTIAASSEDTTQAQSEISVNVSLGDMSGGNANYVVRAQGGTTNQGTVDGDIRVTFTSMTDDTTTFSNVPVSIEVDGLPANTSIDLDFSLNVDTHYYGSDNGESAIGSADFGDTLTFNPTGLHRPGQRFVLRRRRRGSGHREEHGGCGP